FFVLIGDMNIMNKILCSSGAIIGKANNDDYALLKEYAPKLDCDGFELMMSSSWYPILDDVIASVNSYGLNIPVIHSQKSLGEALCGMTSTFSEGRFHDYVMTPDEDKETFIRGTERFRLNLKLAERLGAEKMVLHLWNGTVSDKNIEKNVERFGEWKLLADKAGIELLVENVICNTNSPLENMDLVAKRYPDAAFVYDTKMAEFHDQTMKIFSAEYEYIVREGRIRHLHVNDYGGGYKDWAHMQVLPIGAGHIDFDGFFKKLGKYGYMDDFTVESTALAKDGTVDFDMLNVCFHKIRELKKRFL
nr:sugar phosphate isomerase/epimerase [Lachnospiraceae bacterium]